MSQAPARAWWADVQHDQRVAAVVVIVSAAAFTVRFAAVYVML